MLFSQRLLELYPGILFEESSGGNEGGGGGGGDASDTPTSVGSKQTRKTRAIDMFDAPEPAPRPGEGEPAGAGDGEGKKPMRESRDKVRELSEGLDKSENKKEKSISYFDEEEPETTPQGEPAGGEGEPDPAPTQTDKFYAPDIHAKGEDVYPNSYNSRPDAEYAVANKLSKYEEYADSLQEYDSEVGSTIPSQIQQQIEQYSDVTQLAELDDEGLRAFIVNLDKSLKGLDEKVNRVKQTYNTSQRVSQAEKNFRDAEESARAVVQEIELGPLLKELPENARFEEILALADKQFEQKLLQPINDKITAHESNKELIQSDHQKWLRELRDLEQQRSQVRSDIQEKREKLVSWNDARIEAEEAKKQTEKTKPLSRTERIQKADKIFSSWQEDRSTGPFALDVFKAETTEPIAHLRKFAFAPANFEKFDLTTKAGWDQMHDEWKQTMEKRFAEQRAQQSSQETRRKTDIDEPIPEPERRKTNPTVRKGNKIKQMQESRDNIRKASRALFR